MGRDFENETTAMEILDLERVENRGEVVGIELDVDNCTNDSFYATDDSL